MAEFVIPYALANADMTKINEIPQDKHTIVWNALERIQELRSQRTWLTPMVLINYKNSVYTIHWNADYYGDGFAKAAAKMVELESKYPDIIAAWKEMRSMKDDHNKMHRRNFLREKYPEVVEQYADAYHLCNEKLAEYSPENVKQTVREQLIKLAQRYRTEIAIQKEKWHAENDAIIKECHNQIKFAKKYTYLVSDLKIVTDGVAVTMTGVRRDIRATQSDAPFNMVLINKPIQITR